MPDRIPLGENISVVRGDVDDHAVIPRRFSPAGSRGIDPAPQIHICRDQVVRSDPRNGTCNRLGQRKAFFLRPRIRGGEDSTIFATYASALGVQTSCPYTANNPKYGNGCKGGAAEMPQSSVTGPLEIDNVDRVDERYTTQDCKARPGGREQCLYHILYSSRMKSDEPKGSTVELELR